MVHKIYWGLEISRVPRWDKEVNMICTCGGYSTDRIGIQLRYMKPTSVEVPFFSLVYEEILPKWWKLTCRLLLI
jgi:hypothetical protein